MLKELACVGVSVYVCLYAFIWGYCCGSLLFLLWLLGNAQTGQMCTFFGPSPMCRYSHHLGKNKRGKSTKINRVFTGFTVKVSNVLSQGWEERSKAGDVSMTKEVWVSYIKHLLPPWILWLHMTANKAVLKISRKMRAIHLSMKIINHRL